MIVSGLTSVRTMATQVAAADQTRQLVVGEFDLNYLWIPTL